MSRNPINIAGSYKRPASKVILFGLALTLWLQIIFISPALTASSQDNKIYSLYFPHRSLPALGLESKELTLGSSAYARLRILVSALAAGPQSGSKMNPALPNGVTLRQVFLDQTGVAYLDFDLGKSRSLGLGVLGERLFIWSWVNTISLKPPSIKPLTSFNTCSAGILVSLPRV